ncbi:MAG: putative bifunctional diguanylate cyclase/phosphodiesterase [Porticoccaceae bacterium]
MTSNQSDLRGSMDAKTTGSSPSDQSVKFELNQTLVNHLGTSVGLSVIAGLALVLTRFGAEPSLMAMIWITGLILSHLLLWLTMPRYASPGVVTIVAIAIFGVFWALAGPVFIRDGSLINGILSSTLIILLASVCPLVYLQAPWIRRLATALIYGSIAVFLVLETPSLRFQAPAALLVLFLLVDMANSNCRRALVSQLLKAIGAMERYQHTLNSSHKITSLIEQTPLGFIEWDQNREIISWNPAATAIFGFSRSEALGRTTDFLFEDKKTFLMEQAEHDLFLFGKDFSGTAENITSDGQIIVCEWNETPLFDDQMNVIGAASFVEDVTDRVRMQTRIKQQAYFDPLTGLPNRHRLMEELNRVISLAQRTQNFCALLFIDLDHFKEINDSRGHHYGDLALTLFAQRLRKVIRTQETVARLGGDEFVVLLERLGTEGETARLQIAQVAEKIIDAASEPFIIKGEKFQISCSIGIVFFNDGSSDGHSILEQADQALYTIKREGKSNFYFHNRELSEEMQKQMELLERLRDESKAQSFLPFYQPILDTGNNLINGLQIFLRWQKPSGDIVEAHEFIQVLESGSMIVDISLSLIDQACKQVNLWRSQGIWQDEQRIVFTLSLRELEHPSFILQVQEIMLRHGVKPRLFMFGLHTECLPKINSSLKLQVNRLRELGCGLLVDNVGYQSLPLQTLRELQVETIRISHRLMTESTEIESAWNLVKGLVELARSVGLRCIAPCVEEADFHHRLLDLNCQFLQGNLIAPPSPPTSITRMLIERNTSAPAEASPN